MLQAKVQVHLCKKIQWLCSKSSKCCLIIIRQDCREQSMFGFKSNPIPKWSPSLGFFWLHFILQFVHFQCTYPQMCKVLWLHGLWGFPQKYVTLLKWNASKGRRVYRDPPPPKKPVPRNALLRHLGGAVVAQLCTLLACSKNHGSEVSISSPLRNPSFWRFPLKWPVLSTSICWSWLFSLRSALQNLSHLKGSNCLYCLYSYLLKLLHLVVFKVIITYIYMCVCLLH